MPQYWSHTRRWLAACLTAATVASPHCAAAEPAAEPGMTSAAPIQGEMISGDAPTMYRLPLIGLCEPEDEARVIENGGFGTPATAKPPVVNGTQRAGLPYPANPTGLTTQLLPAVQRGYTLAQRGAFFAARTEFIQVMRRVAQAKDAAGGTDQYSVALAAGLRAIDEAEDFVPRGTQLEAELDVRKVASAHRTPVMKEHAETVLPHEAASLYHSYAQQKLAHAAVDEQAGSMALYGLGKVYSRLAERRDDDAQCLRGAITMYCAALDACPNNNLAANELGVVLCRTGHAAEALANFTRAIDIAPTATAYHNLAVAQRSLNMPAESTANEIESQRLAALERATNTLSRQAGIQWVTPEELARAAQSGTFSPTVAPAATDPAVATRPTSPPRHKWR
jgi:tetratricopeptide (TPR) repeat protein